MAPTDHIVAADAEHQGTSLRGVKVAGMLKQLLTSDRFIKPTYLIALSNPHIVKV